MDRLIGVFNKNSLLQYFHAKSFERGKADTVLEALSEVSLWGISRKVQIDFGAYFQIAKFKEFFDTKKKKKKKKKI